MKPELKKNRGLIEKTDTYVVSEDGKSIMVKLTIDFEEILNSLLDNKEIAKRVIEEYIGTDSLGKLKENDAIYIEDIFDWLEGLE